jgi:hypothetical protein
MVKIPKVQIFPFRHSRILTFCLFFKFTEFGSQKVLVIKIQMLLYFLGTFRATFVKFGLFLKLC